MIDTMNRGPIYLMGIALKKKTCNENGQSNVDCGNHWREFEKRQVAAQIPDKSGQEIYAVYYQYEGDHTKPYAYFIGCPVGENTPTPEGLDKLVIPRSDYLIVKAKGRIPDCISSAWQKIWDAQFPRAYRYDFEVYDQRSRDWENGEIDIFLSVNTISSFPE